MADTKEQSHDTGSKATQSEKAQLETLAFVPLTEAQSAKVKTELGIDIGYLLVQKHSRTLARDIDPGFVSLVRLTWCW